MKRGEVWTLLDTGYASKPRPVVVMQGAAGDRFDSVVVCLFTSHLSEDVRTRPRVEPTDSNGLERASWVMTEKLLSVARTKLGQRIGCLEDADLRAIGAAIAELLEITPAEATP